MPDFYVKTLNGLYRSLTVTLTHKHKQQNFILEDCRYATPQVFHLTALIVLHGSNEGCSRIKLRDMEKN